MWYISKYTLTKFYFYILYFLLIYIYDKILHLINFNIILTFFLASWRSTISSHRLFSFSFAIVFSEENHFLIRSSRNFLISIFLFVAFWYTIYAFTMVVPKRKYNLRYHLMIFRMLLQLSGRFYRCRFFHYYMQLPLMISFFEDDRDE